MAGRGRPKGSGSKFTADARDGILQRRKLGLPITFCAQAVGVDARTVHRWLKLGYEHIDGSIDSDFADFASEYKKAEADGVAAHLAKIHRADQWQSSAWILSRCYPEHFGKLVEEHPPAPVVIQTGGGGELPEEVEQHPDVQEAIAHYADVVARVERELA